CVCAQLPSCCTQTWSASCANLACANACAPFCDAGRTYCAALCRDLQTDPDHCGSCDHTCANDHGSVAAVPGSCVGGTCTLGFCDADGLSSNGCELELAPGQTCPPS